MAEYQENLAVQREYYDRTAKNYDEWHIEPGSSQIVDQWNFNNLKKYLGNKKINRILDLGCGTGRLSRRLLTISPEVYGVDASKEVLKIAREKNPELKLAFAEAIDLPYEDEFFDLVIINGSLHHFFAMEQTFKEVSRVLASGGVFAILGEPNSNFGKWWNPFKYKFLAYRFLFYIFNLFRTKKMSASEPIEPDAESFTIHQFKKSLSQLEFTDLQIYTYDYLPRMESRWWLKLYSGYLQLEHRSLTKALPGLGSAIQCFARKK